MGLRKDANSLSQLRRGDFIRIENGETTYLKYNLFEKRLRSLIFEFQQYKQTKNPNNQTLIQRFFYWKIALKTFSKHWFFGYGTGGYKEAMSKEYKMASSILDIENQKFPHNQFLTQLINLVCENPVKIFGIKNKGFIKEVYDADFTVVDMNRTIQIKN